MAWIMASRLGRILSALLAAVVVLAGMFLSGRHTQRKSEEVDDLKDYVKTQEAVNEVEPSPTRDAAVERLRDNDLIR